ncbi:SRPBCC family protein [Sphaerisporangium rhizosphaerae]|uniref:SRPBCC family protein n=1 Tax=Sphaerisporangium rhizosphaerae TaxID=2269375 RepID=A0ABW2P1L4_9ACTN
MDLGTSIEHRGRPAVRFERVYDHPVERVWEAVATPGGLAHWFPSAVELEPHAGGKITFSGDPNLETMTGTVVTFEPPRRLAFTWGGDELHFYLEPAGDHGCRLTLVNVLERADTAARNAAGWTVCLAELDKHLAGAAAGGPHSDTALPWRQVYEAHVSSGMPSGAPIPGAPRETPDTAN